MASHTPSQRYLSTRGGSYNARDHLSDRSNRYANVKQLSFEDVVLKGLASDGGLFIPEEVPTIPKQWSSKWQDFSFQELAYHIFSLYISPDEIPAQDLQNIVQRSYSTFRVPEITPLVTLDEDRNLHILELFHGPTFAFKDVALQFLGNLFEYFLVRRNKGKKEGRREHLTVVGATSGDTGSAAIYGLRAKADVSIFIMHPKGRVSAVQEAQMTSVLDANVHNLALDGTFDDCQDFVKALFGDEDMNKTHKLAAVNSINWARILAQITYYFHAYASLMKSGRLSADSKVRATVPSGNFGDVLAGYFAKRMGLPIEKLVIATNENDILDRFWRTGRYEKKKVHGSEATGGFAEDGVKAHEDGVKETLSPAMDILVSSNFERLLWFLAFQVYGHGDAKQDRTTAGERVKGWLNELKIKGGFTGEPAILEAARIDFESERVSDEETIATIRRVYSHKASVPINNAANGAGRTLNTGGYILDPHSAIGIAACLRSMERAPPSKTHYISLATAHPAKFSKAVELALKDEKAFSFEKLLPEEFVGLEKKPRRVTEVKKSEGFQGVRALIRERVPASA